MTGDGPYSSFIEVACEKKIYIPKEKSLVKVFAYNFFAECNSGSLSMSLKDILETIT